MWAWHNCWRSRPTHHCEELLLRKNALNSFFSSSECSSSLLNGNGMIRLWKPESVGGVDCRLTRTLIMIECCYNPPTRSICLAILVSIAFLNISSTGFCLLSPRGLTWFNNGECCCVSFFSYFAFTFVTPLMRPPMCSAANYFVLRTTTYWTTF